MSRGGRRREAKLSKLARKNATPAVRAAALYARSGATRCPEYGSLVIGFVGDAPSARVAVLTPAVDPLAIARRRSLHGGLAVGGACYLTPDRHTRLALAVRAVAGPVCRPPDRIVGIRINPD